MAGNWRETSLAKYGFKSTKYWASIPGQITSTPYTSGPEAPVPSNSRHKTSLCRAESGDGRRLTRIPVSRANCCNSCWRASLNVLFAVATGVYPAFILSLLVQLHRPGSSLELPCTCSLFGLPLRSFSTSCSLFSIACSLFSKNTRGGGVSVALDTYTRGWILGKQSRSTQS